jgi:hypothetical protein
MKRYRQNALDPGEWLEIDDHLTACEDCRHKLRETVPARETLLALQADMRAEPRIEEPGLWKRFLELSGLAAYRDRQAQERARFKLTPRVAVTAVIISLLLAVTALWLRSREDKRNVRKTTSSPTMPPQPSPNPPPNLPPELPPQIQIAINDGGGRVTLDAQGKLAGLESLTPSAQQLVRAALTTQKIETPKMLKELEGVSVLAMGGSSNESFKLIRPVGKIVVDNQPTFRWQPLGDASSYQVTITDPKANYKEVAVSPALSNPEWRVARPLVRGRVYAWQVTARTDGREIKAPSRDAPEARFGVLEQEKATELAQAKRDYAGRRLVLGLYYAQAGLLDEAEREFQALTMANPESVVAKNLLRNVRVKRRLNIRPQPR